MTANHLRTSPIRGPARLSRVVLLSTILSLFALCAFDAARADDVDVSPISPELTRYLEWNKRNLNQKPSATENDSPTNEDIARFREWYKRNGAPKPPGASDVPQSEDVVRFLEWHKRNGAPKAILLEDRAGAQPAAEEVARYLNWFKRNGPPAPIAAPVPQPLPVITAVDVKPIQDSAVRQARAHETMRVVPPPRPAARIGQPKVLAESVPPPLPRDIVEAPSITPAPTPLTPFDKMLAQVGCSNCGTAGGTLGSGGSYHGGPAAPSGPDCACGSGNCVPGRLHNCSPCEANTFVGRFLCGVYECICCPDPCYDPKWIPLADAAFFTESARPETQQRLRWDAGRNLTNPDRAEYFWARADGKGKGPSVGSRPNPNNSLGEERVNYNDLSIYTEAALGNIGTFVELPYRSLSGELDGHFAGFGDINLGTKTLLFDCELLQITLLFRTYLPLGNAGKGLGTGHVSLEPGLIIGLKLAPDAYFQGEVAEWIPLGGDADYQGAILEYHGSFNQVLCRILPDVPLVGTLEFNGWSFQHGQYTDPELGPGQRASRGMYFSMGPGLRLFICDKIDFGVGTAFAVTQRHWADELFRSEFRWRF